MTETELKSQIPADFYQKHNFSPVMRPPKPLKHVKLSISEYPDAVASMDWLVGGYMENRQGMYSSELYQAVRYIHLGIDIWAPPGEPVFAIADGVILGAKDNANELDYGPTIIVEHTILGVKFYTLYGHLSRKSIAGIESGTSVKRGDLIALLGDETENGGWVPHLHFGLGIEKPTDIDMPGVCAPEDEQKFRVLYPDPRYVLGPLY
ncbi:MAG TPA: peptidase M23 [Bacteroidetes bacterium]|nr:peptidase M23 [Bacteroidota bacterium]